MGIKLRRRGCRDEQILVSLIYSFCPGGGHISEGVNRSLLFARDLLSGIKKSSAVSPAKVGAFSIPRVVFQAVTESNSS